MEATLATIGALILTRVLAEICFSVADYCGRRRSPRAKRIGKSAWELGRVFSVIGGVTESYVRKKYQGRGK